MLGERRSTGVMPYRRRQHGLTALDRREETFLWSASLTLLTAIGIFINLPDYDNALLVGAMALVPAFVARAATWKANLPIDKAINFCFQL